MKFSKVFLKEEVPELKGDDLPVFEEIVDTGRWTILYRTVFRWEGKFYVTYFNRGATENQEERPYQYDLDQIECEEVFPVEVKSIQYLTKAQQALI